jgi:uncharacterized protein (DUF1778 family)
MKRRNEVAALHKIGFRVTPKEKKLIAKLAKEAKETMANYCRKKAMETA